MSELVKVRNKSGEARYIPLPAPLQGIEVAKDEVFEIPEGLVAGLVCQSIYELVDAPKKAPAKSPKDPEKQ